MYFRSTQANDVPVSFRTAVLNGIPERGGLYVPADIPDLRQFFLYMDTEISYTELVSTISLALFGDILNPILSEKIAAEAYQFEPRLVPVNEHISILELYNGPSGLFKDFGLSYCASLIEAFVGGEGKAVTLNASSGRSGASIARAFAGKKNSLVVLLYPKGPILGLDAAAFVENGGNIFPVQVDGTLDDCQRLVQEAFMQRAFVERYSLTTANSLNVARLLPQTFYYLYSFIMLKKRMHADFVFSVPSGNFGNLIAGLYAWKFGLPANAFIAAMNENNSLGAYLKGGQFKPKKGKPTFSSSMDIGNPSNFERLEAFYEEAPAVMRNMVVPRTVSEKETKETICNLYKREGILLDPHSAVAYAAAEQHLAGDVEDGHIVVLATGHPAIRASQLEALIGEKVSLPPSLTFYENTSEAVAVIPPHIEALEPLIAGACP